MTDNEAFIVQFVVVFAIVLAVFIVPTVVAFGRRHPNRWLILVVNLAFGATGVGWLATLVWALHAAHQPELRGGGESGLNLFVNDPVVARHQIVRLVEAPGELTVAEMATQLERLKELRSAETISLAEFDSLKAKLLDFR